MVDMMQGDRGILEFTYNFPGMFMFHAHKTEFTMKGWMGMFNVTKTGSPDLEKENDWVSKVNGVANKMINTEEIFNNATLHAGISTSTNNHLNSTNSKITSSNPGLVGI
jgi:hypothetical protein